MVVQIFVPFTAQPPSTRRAVVRRLASPIRPRGSEYPWQYRCSQLRIGGRNASCWATVPCWIRAGPTIRTPWSGTSETARRSCSSKKISSLAGSRPHGRRTRPATRARSSRAARHVPDRNPAVHIHNKPARADETEVLWDRPASNSAIDETQRNCVVCHGGPVSGLRDAEARRARIVVVAHRRGASLQVRVAVSTSYSRLLPPVLATAGREACRNGGGCSCCCPATRRSPATGSRSVPSSYSSVKPIAPCNWTQSLADPQRGRGCPCHSHHSPTADRLSRPASAGSRTAASDGGLGKLQLDPHVDSLVLQALGNCRSTCRTGAGCAR